MNIEFGIRTVGSIGFHADGSFAARREFDGINLSIPLRIKLHGEPQQTWLCEDIHFELFGLPPDDVERLICCGPLTEILTSTLSANERISRVPLSGSSAAVAAFERARNGGPVRFRLKLRAKMHALVAATESNARALGEPHWIFVHEDFTADKEKWIAALRSAHLSVSVLVEVPFPLVGEPEDAFLKAIAEACMSFENGGSVAWKDSVGHLRPLLESWFKAQPKPATEPRDGSAADRDWKLLNLRDALYKLCHFWVHESASQCRRDEALLMLASVAALVKAYRSS